VIPGRAKTAIPVKIQLNSPNSNCKQYPLRKEAKEAKLLRDF
jgi:hypothetical protein